MLEKELCQFVLMAEGFAECFLRNLFRVRQIPGDGQSLIDQLASIAFHQVPKALRKLIASVFERLNENLFCLGGNRHGFSDLLQTRPAMEVRSW